MTMIALYVYTPTTLTTDTAIQPMTGAALKPGTVQLAPGVYKTLASAKLAASTGSFDQVAPVDAKALDGTKQQWPDPPAKITQVTGTSKAAISAFLTGAGESIVLT
jgi:hypothetical protein